MRKYGKGQELEFYDQVLVGLAETIRTASRILTVMSEGLSEHLIFELAILDLRV